MGNLSISEVLGDEPTQNVLPSSTLSIKEVTDTPSTLSLGETLQTQTTAIPQGPDNSSYVDLEGVFKEYGRKLIKEDIVNDDLHMEVVGSSLDSRFTPGGVLTKASRGFTGLAGGTIAGLSSQYSRETSSADAFESWQN